MMPFAEIVREALSSQAAAKQRTILALIGIVIGIGSVIALVTVGQMVQLTSLQQFQQMGTNIITVQRGWGDKGGGNAKQQGPSQHMTWGDAEDLKANVSGLEMVAPYTSTWGQPLYTDRPLDMPVMGVTRSFADINKLEVLKGRFISDLDGYSFFGVLGAGAAQKLAKLGVADPVGKTVFFKKRGFKIVGVLKRTAEGGMRPYEINPGMMIPVRTSYLFKRERNVNEIMARLAPNADRHLVIKAVKRYFKQRHPGMLTQVRSAEQLIAEMAKQSQLFTLLLGAIGSISLLVGGIGVMNVMLVAVTERRKEIGIRRALGAEQIDIQAQFLVESVILCLAGGLIGIALGVGAAYVLSKVNGWIFFVSGWGLALGVGVSSAIGVFFGYFPARQASRLNPILALRDE
ncbi:MAG: ABC transporter permease [Desulfarculaceae bacterium]|nr:ABC transporter permease [Desulfarculaceae bacterium]MCF8071952.1 ABC transporter permease [Desulfarculaceae bacterium]MCF8101469.1 ABC transporter permease [Desulfarculaceae bacterium]MCF8115019.1 ABC transporter permease [Desulfarculaceae bacterium]